MVLFIYYIECYRVSSRENMIMKEIQRISITDAVVNNLREMFERFLTMQT